MRFQIQMRAVLGVEQEAIYNICWQKTGPCSGTLRKTDGLINLVEEISRQPSIQAMHGFC
jgi:hypothetical protein